MHPEDIADLMFNGLTEPPGMWTWHRDQTDEWNRRAEAHWEVLVEDMMREISRLGGQP